MSDVEGATRALGALLVRTDDVPSAARAVHLYLLEPNRRHAEEVEALGVTVSTLEEFRPILPTDFVGVAEVCQLGSIWATARADAGDGPSWEPVITGQSADPALFPRRTAETLVTLAIDARHSIELFAPFADPSGVRAVGRALAGATGRGVRVVFAHRVASEAAAETLVSLVASHGTVENLKLVPIEDGGRYPHLKLMIIDGERAYLGSANLTYAALVSNLEVGALVTGPGVAALSRMFTVLLQETHEFKPSPGAPPPV